MSVSDNIAPFPPSETFQPGQALASAGQHDLRHVFVIGYDEEGDLVVRSSRMTRAEPLWLIEHAKLWTLGRLK